MAITYENQVGYILNLWDDSIAFKDDLARIFFTATIVEALEMAHQAGKKAEAKKRKASISARYQKRLTQRAPDAPKRGAKVVKSKSKVIKGRARR